MIKTRIAPSPTGNLHLGTVRTALYNVLLAKSKGGKFYFRLEDTDRERSKEEFTQEIIDGFKWLGITWDGEMIRQSACQAKHQEYIDKLLSEHKAYKCYANTGELEDLRSKQRAKKEAEGYDNRSRDLTQEQIAAYEAEGRKYVIRLNLGKDRDIQWQDAVRGSMSINTRDLGGDPVIQKYNGQVLYNFAVVVDDHEMGITHVFRGEDHLTNTAKQIAIYQALGFASPEFGHLPLIFTQDRQKLSKRKHGDIAGIEKYRKEGYLPEALANYLVATSYTAPGDLEVYTMTEATGSFDPSRLSKSPAVYDIGKLNWFNREYISRLSHDALMIYLKPFLKYDLSVFNDNQQRDLMDAIKGNLNKFDEINDNISYFFDEPVIDDKSSKFIEEGKVVLQKLLAILTEASFDFTDAVLIKNEINRLGEELGLKGKQLFWPIRIALSGRSHGPDLGLVISLLGRDKSLARLAL